jgi:hypothetical protein
MKPYVLWLYEVNPDGVGAYKWRRIIIFFLTAVALNIALFVALSAVFRVWPLIDGRGASAIVLFYIFLTALICFRQRRLGRK